MRGGEKLLETLCQHYKEAPIWTLLYVRGTVSRAISSHTIYPSLLQHVPAVAKRYRNYLPLFPFLAELHKAKASQVIISSSHAVAKSMASRRKGGPLHICYIHTPMRYAWDLFEDYFGVDRKGWFLSRCFYLPIAKTLQLYDRATAGRVDLFIANSRYIAERVMRIYGREARVVPPPVALDRFLTLERMPEDWYLVVSSLAPYKRVADAVHACHRLGLKLKIIGAGPEYDALSSLSKSLDADIEMLGALDDVAVENHYSRAKALLFPGIEDFGIVPVEAIASGCPVIAFAKGGILDSMTEKTAVFYDEQTVDGLIEAIRQFQIRSADFDTDEMRQHARKFSDKQFISSFTTIVDDLLSKRSLGTTSQSCDLLQQQPEPSSRAI